MSEQRDMVGTLSRNKRRETDKQPEFRGSCMIDGVGYWISGWVKEGDDGRFFSLAFKEQRSAAPTGISGPGPGHRRGVPDDEVPFSPEWR